MKLIQHKSERKRQIAPMLGVDSKGVFRLNRMACEVLKLTYGDVIGLFQDEERPSDWYLRKLSKTDEGFTVRKAGINSLCFNTANSYKAMAISLNVLGNFSCPISSEPTDGYYAIITHSIHQSSQAKTIES